MMNEQKRQPKGTPVGGQFTAVERADTGDLGAATSDWMTLSDTSLEHSERVAAALRYDKAYPFLSTRVRNLSRIDEIESERLTTERDADDRKPRVDRLRNRRTGEEMTVESAFFARDFLGGLTEKVEAAQNDRDAYDELSRFLGADMIDAYVYGHR